MSTAQQSRRKRRIVILGGGVGAMTTAFGLTNYPGWQEHYEVILYNLGWRLGGKGASGRNKDAAQRIEEHGLHVWMGHYENAFRVMREAYRELGRPPGAPLATVDEAFKKQSLITLFERTSTRWVNWGFPFATNSQEPGTEGEDGGLPTLVTYLERGFQALLHVLSQAPAAGLAAATPSRTRCLPGWKGCCGPSGSRSSRRPGCRGSDGRCSWRSCSRRGCRGSPGSRSRASWTRSCGSLRRS